VLSHAGPLKEASIAHCLGTFDFAVVHLRCVGSFWLLQKVHWDAGGANGAGVLTVLNPTGACPRKTDPSEPLEKPYSFLLATVSPSPPAAKMISQTPEWAKKTVGDVGIFRLHEVPHKRSPAYSFGPPDVLPDQVLRARSTTILYSLTRSLSILFFISSVPTFTRPHCHTSSSHARSHESRSTPTPLLRVPRYSGLSRHLVSLAGPS
jgi:hypothetical protein